MLDSYSCLPAFVALGSSASGTRSLLTIGRWFRVVSRAGMMASITVRRTYPPRIERIQRMEYEQHHSLCERLAQLLSQEVHSVAVCACLACLSCLSTRWYGHATRLVSHVCIIHQMLDASELSVLNSCATCMSVVDAAFQTHDDAVSYCKSTPNMTLPETTSHHVT